MVWFCWRIRYAIIAFFIAWAAIFGASLNAWGFGECIMAAAGRSGGVEPCLDPGNITLSTSLLIHSNHKDDDAATTQVIDSSPYNRKITRSGTPHHEDDQAYFGNSSLYFNGSGSLEFADSPEFDFSDATDGKWTIELFARPTAQTSADVLVSNWDSTGADRSYELIMVGTRQFRCDVSPDGGATSDTYWAIANGSASFDTWYHLACVCDGSTLKLYIDGSAQTDTGDCSTVNSNTELKIGDESTPDAGSDPFTGHGDEIRLEKGLAIYTGNFTPPTNPYSTTCYPLDGYARRVKLTTDSSIIDSTLTDFPITVLPDSSTGITSIDLTGNLLAWACGSHDTEDLKYNIAVTTDDEFTQIPVESALVDCANDIMELHFNAESLPADTNKDFYLYYGGYYTNDEWVGSVDYLPSNASLVWPNTVMVHHFNGATVTGNIDSSGTGNDISAAGGDPDYKQLSKVGYGVNFTAASSEYLSIPDDDTLSFGNGSTDSQFSVFGVAKMDDATKFRFVYKGDAAGTNCEYLFTVNSSDYLANVLYDGNCSNYEQIRSNATFTSDQGSWISVAGTYDGTGGGAASTGLEEYKNGSNIASTISDFGSYTAMHNQSTNVYIGSLATQAGSYSDGIIDELYVFDYEIGVNFNSVLHDSAFDSLLTYLSGPVASPKYIPISNTNIYGPDQFEDLTGWANDDFGLGTSYQTTFGGFATLLLDTVGNSTDYARQEIDVGTLSGRSVVSIRIYPETLNATTTGWATIGIKSSDADTILISFANDGLYYYDGATYTEIGTDLNLLCSGGSSADGCWQEWTFDVNWTAETLDIYTRVDGGFLLLISDFDYTGYTTGEADGWFRLTADGFSDYAKIYVDYVKVGTAFLNE